MTRSRIPGLSLGHTYDSIDLTITQLLTFLLSWMTSRAINDAPGWKQPLLPGVFRRNCAETETFVAFSQFYSAEILKE